MEGEALLLPELSGLKQAASIITARGFCKVGDVLKVDGDNNSSKIVVNELVERTARFERYQYSLI